MLNKNSIRQLLYYHKVEFFFKNCLKWLNLFKKRYYHLVSIKNKRLNLFLKMKDNYIHLGAPLTSLNRFGTVWCWCVRIPPVKPYLTLDSPITHFLMFLASDITRLHIITIRVKPTKPYSFFHIFS